MAHPHVHAENSVKKFGGVVDDYIDIHAWFDETKAWHGTMAHRAMRHHTEGIFECEKVFGKVFTNSEGKTVYTRYVGEQHIIEDLGFIPTAHDWMSEMNLQKWMLSRDKRVKQKKRIDDKLPSSLIKY